MTVSVFREFTFSAKLKMFIFNYEIQTKEYLKFIINLFHENLYPDNPQLFAMTFIVKIKAMYLI